LKKTINVALYETHGKPEDVLKIVAQPCPEPGPAEVLVQMLAAPVNPADLNAIEGKYPGRPEVPATPGMEGVGTVVETGAQSHSIKVGDHVLLPHHIGTWREALVVDAEDLIPVPAQIDPVQAATLKINPLTAWRLLHGYVQLKPGDWVIQNAANSAAGRAVIQISHELGFKIINVVRRSELIEELRNQGGDVVLVDGENLRHEAKAASNGSPIRLALNAVGGESALHLANALAPSATMVTYGAMSLQPLKIPNGLLIFKDLRFRGIWINKWYDNASPDERLAAFRPLFDMAQRGILKTKVEKIYSFRDVKTAVAHATQGKRSGKIILQFQ
jgi:mitochondrial enoyl-[acyl-carrier protein] reductase / trans-2-enoyl-CoA reductase